MIREREYILRYDAGLASWQWNCSAMTKLRSHISMSDLRLS